MFLLAYLENTTTQKRPLKLQTQFLVFGLLLRPLLVNHTKYVFKLFIPFL